MAALAWSAWRDCPAALATIHSSADRPSPFAAGEGHLTQQVTLSPGKAFRSVGRISDPAHTAPQSVRGSDRVAGAHALTHAPGRPTIPVTAVTGSRHRPSDRDGSLTSEPQGLHPPRGSITNEKRGPDGRH